MVTVRDEGVGIPPEDLPHVFERYRRGSNVGNRTRGAGIGLAGVRQIVEQHGGCVAVESEEGGGSTFTTVLPLAPPETPEQRRTRGQSGRSPRTSRAFASADPPPP